MKNLKVGFAVIILISGLAACNDSAKVAAKEDAVILTEYVDSVESLPPVYTVENWTTIDNGYQERATRAEKTIANLEVADKEKTEASKAKYATLKASYETKLKEKEAADKMAVTTSDYRQDLRNRLFGEGKIGADMKFGFVTANNIMEVYNKFVNDVQDNRNNLYKGRLG